MENIEYCGCNIGSIEQMDEFVYYRGFSLVDDLANLGRDPISERDPKETKRLRKEHAVDNLRGKGQLIDEVVDLIEENPSLTTPEKEAVIRYRGLTSTLLQSATELEESYSGPLREQILDRSTDKFDEVTEAYRTRAGELPLKQHLSVLRKGRQQMNDLYGKD